MHALLGREGMGDVQGVEGAVEGPWDGARYEDALVAEVKVHISRLLKRRTRA